MPPSPAYPEDEGSILHKRWYAPISLYGVITLNTTIRTTLFYHGVFKTVYITVSNILCELRRKCLL
jgi:hypothetical protein